MTKSAATDVLICGAGAAGLTLAIDLARRGVDFRLIDKADRPFAGSRGKGIQPRSQEVFEDLGVLDRMTAAGGRYPLLRNYRAQGHEDTAMMEAGEPTPGEPYVRPLMLPQHLTEMLSRERLAELGHRPAFARELIGFVQDGDGVTATLRVGQAEEIVRARFLVGADGGRSLVRQALDIGFPGETLPGRALVADLDLGGLSDDFWHRWDGVAGGPFSLCPLRGTDLFQLQCALPADKEPDLSAAGLQAMIAERTGRRDLAVRSVQWSSVYGMNIRVADRFRIGRVLLAGDAAHVHPPTGGQGLNTSIQDAYNLGWKLAAVLEGAPSDLLMSYETERRPIAEHVLDLAKKLLRAARERGEMRRGRETHELDLAYLDSPVSLDARARPSRVRAGNRAADAPCRGAAGQRLRLFHVFKGPQWTLLSYECDRRQRPVEPRKGLAQHHVGRHGDIVDEGGHIREAYDLLPGDRVLVRPDGYIGAIVDTDSTSRLEGYMADRGLPPLSA